MPGGGFTFASMLYQFKNGWQFDVAVSCVDDGVHTPRGIEFWSGFSLLAGYATSFGSLWGVIVTLLMYVIDWHSFPSPSLHWTRSLGTSLMLTQSLGKLFHCSKMRRT
jgi:hypothetical protein